MRRLLAALAVLFVPLASAADAIHVAAGNGEIETVRRLLEEDPKRVNARQQDGRAPCCRLRFAGIRILRGSCWITAQIPI